MKVAFESTVAERSDPNFSSSRGEILLLQSPALSPFSPSCQAWHWAESQALVLLQDVVLVDMRALMSSCLSASSRKEKVQGTGGVLGDQRMQMETGFLRY